MTHKSFKKAKKQKLNNVSDDCWENSFQTAFWGLIHTLHVRKGIFLG